MTVQLVTFVLYFALVFAIGWWSLRHTRDEADYWIAGGDLGWLVGGATLGATHASAGTFIGTIGVMYTTGWSFGWLVLAIPLAYWFMAAVLAPRFTRVRELTLPAFIGSRYHSDLARAVAACIILLATVVYIQAQIVAGGLVANIVFGVPTEWGMLGFTAILLIYTVVGGMLAVVYTDFLQLVVMALGVLVAVPLAIRGVGGGAELFRLVEAVNPRTFAWDTLPGTLLFTMGLAFFLGSVSSPAQLVRLYAMRDMRAIRRGVLFGVVLITGLNLMVFLLSLAAVVLFPSLPTGDLAMPMIARAVLPPFLGGLVLAAVTAAMMSTVDSLLIVAGSALSVDIFETLVAPDASPRARGWVNRIGVVVVGTVPVVLLLSGVGEGELVQFIVLLFTALMASAFFAPVVLGVTWRRATREGAVAAMVGGLAAALLWEVLGWENVDPVLPGFLTSCCLMVGVSLATPAPPREAVAPYFDGAEPDRSGAPVVADRRSE
jgi:SSS family transporter